MSTITSVRKREEEPRRLGRVMPVHSPGCGEVWATSTSGSNAGSEPSSSASSATSSVTTERSTSTTGSSAAPSATSMPKIACRSGPACC